MAWTKAGLTEMETRGMVESDLLFSLFHTTQKILVATGPDNDDMIDFSQEARRKRYQHDHSLKLISRDFEGSRTLERVSEPANPLRYSDSIVSYKKQPEHRP